ncbi:penicillin-binding protein, 1A family, partial [mine drainage metagenome]
QNMVAVGDITAKQAKAAYAEPLHLQNNAVSQGYPDPWFLDYVITSLRGRISLQEIMNGGLRIYTTLDPRVQTIAQNAVTGIMQQNFPSTAAIPEPQAAAVVMDPHNGYVLAIVGGRTHPVALPMDRAVEPYQTGSAIKPLAEYPVAIQSGKFTSATVLDDGPWYRLPSGKFWPKNDTNLYYGRITLRHSLAISDNNNSVHLLDLVGVNAGFNMATQKFGLPLVGSGPANDRNLAMGIGGLT